jgi:hypothetical protein
MKIWVNEQIDPSGIVYSCIAYSNEDSAKACYEGWLNELTQEEKNNGWEVRLRTVESWDDVPVNALKLSY